MQTLKSERSSVMIIQRVIGLVSCTVNQRLKLVNTTQLTAAKVIKLFLLNIVLAFSLAVCVCALFLNHATSQLKNSFAITLVTAVIAIVTSCFLSIGRKLARRTVANFSRKLPDFQQIPSPEVFHIGTAKLPGTPGFVADVPELDAVGGGMSVFRALCTHMRKGRPVHVLDFLGG